jgi:hypothetical protein
MKPLRCEACGAPMEIDAITCSYCGTSYLAPNIQIDAELEDYGPASMIVDILPVIMTMAMLQAIWSAVTSIKSLK